MRQFMFLQKQIIFHYFEISAERSLLFQFLKSYFNFYCPLIPLDSAVMAVLWNFND